MQLREIGKPIPKNSLILSKKIKIKGNNLFINYFEKEEINIKGNISNIEINDI